MSEKPLTGPVFAQTLLDWQAQHGRHTLPWQNTGDPYKVWLSEVMLQQTQVSTVLGYFQRFLERFPTVADLAEASEEEVFALWAGLGYYSRARNLHACAQAVCSRFGGQFPECPTLLESLPGIGRSTAGAIASLAFGQPAPILDGNVKRVFCRYYAVQGYPEATVVKKALWGIAQANVPVQQAGRYNQALMDLGAGTCTPRKPACSQCPLQSGCQALALGLVGSLPEPKPKKPRPVLHHLLLLSRTPSGQYLLVHQANKGVWHGLWMFPMLALPQGQIDGGAVFPWLAQCGVLDDELPGPVALDAVAGQDWIVHELTHRRLLFKALVINRTGELANHWPFDGKPLPALASKVVQQLGL